MTKKEQKISKVRSIFKEIIYLVATKVRDAASEGGITPLRHSHILKFADEFGGYA